VDVLDLVDLEGVGLADGREQRLFRETPQQPEQDVGGLDGVLALGPGVLQEGLDLRTQSGHQVVDPLELGAGRAQKKPFPVGRKFRLVVFCE